MEQRSRRAVAILEDHEDSWMDTLRDSCNATNTELNVVHRNFLRTYFCDSTGTILLFLKPRQFDWSIASIVLESFQYSLYADARYIGILPLKDSSTIERYYERVEQQRSQPFMNGLILLDEPHSSQNSGFDQHGNMVLRPYDDGLTLNRINSAIAEHEVSCLSGRLNGRFHHLFLQCAAITTRPKQNEVSFHPQDIAVPNIFINSCCSSVRQPSHNLSHPLSSAFLNHTAISFIGSTRIHQGFPQLEVLYPRLLKDGYSVGQTNAILNGIIRNSGFDQPIFLLYGDPDFQYSKTPAANESTDTVILDNTDENFEPILYTEKSTRGYYGAVDGPNDGEKTLFIWGDKFRGDVIHMSSSDVNRAKSREQSMRLGVAELTHLLPKNNETRKVLGVLSDIRNKVEARRGKKALRPVTSIHRVRYDLEGAREFFRSTAESDTKIEKLHNEIGNFFMRRSDHYWSGLRAEHPAYRISSQNRHLALNYYDLYSTYHARCETVTTIYTDHRCPFCDSFLFSRTLCVATDEPQRRLLVCPLDFVIGDIPHDSAVDVLRINCETPSLTTDVHLYRITFRNEARHDIMLSAFPALSYLNDQCGTPLTQPIDLTCDPIISKRSVRIGETVTFTTSVSPVDAASLKMYILQIFVFSDLRLYFAARNFIGHE